MNEPKHRSRWSAHIAAIWYEEIKSSENNNLVDSYKTLDRFVFNNDNPMWNLIPVESHYNQKFYKIIMLRITIYNFKYIIPSGMYSDELSQKNLKNPHIQAEFRAESFGLNSKNNYPVYTTIALTDSFVTNTIVRVA